MNRLSNFDGNFIDGLEFCRDVYSLIEDIRASKNGISELRMRSSVLEKRLLEELYPICKYIQDSYRVGRYISVCWVDGNQKFDAKVQEKGWLVDQGYYLAESLLEVTCSVHPKDYLAREKIENDGFCYGYDGLTRNKDRSVDSQAISYNGLAFIEQDAELVLQAITKKAGKKYPENTILIVQASLLTVYADFEWNKMVEHVKSKIKDNPFNMIFITDSNHVYTSKIYRE